MVRKITVFLVAISLFLCVSTVASATSFDEDADGRIYLYPEIYDGSFSTSLLSYFEGLLPKISLFDHYVIFRSEENEYLMVYGDITFDGFSFYNNETVNANVIYKESGYNSEWCMYLSPPIDEFYLENASDKIVYSDLGHYPELDERGSKYEILTAILVATGLLGVVVGRFFRRR